MENMAEVLSKNERLTLLRLLKNWTNTPPKLASKRYRPRHKGSRDTCRRKTLRNLAAMTGSRSRITSVKSED